MDRGGQRDHSQTSFTPEATFRMTRNNRLPGCYIPDIDALVIAGAEKLASIRHNFPGLHGPRVHPRLLRLNLTTVLALRVSLPPFMVFVQILDLY